MANHKRRRSRRHVRCTLCTSHRFGNSRESGKAKVIAAAKAAQAQMKEHTA